MLIFNWLVLGLVGSILFIVLYSNLHRQKLRYKFSLQPNCLLTSHPIIFLSGKTSLFYFGKYWNCIPEWLEAHGYDVMEFNFSKNSRETRIQELQSFLELTKGEALHFAGDASSLDELNWLAKQDMPTEASLTMFSNTEPRNLCEKIRFNRVLSEKNGAHSHTYWGVLTRLHSIAKAPIEGQTLCTPNHKNLNQVAHQYLHWAISLAERDMS